MIKSTKDLPKATKEQVNLWYKEAQEFIKATHFYQDMRYDAELAVTEFIAAQNGYTIRKW